MTRRVALSFLAAAVVLIACDRSEADEAADHGPRVSGAFGLEGTFPPDFDPCALISSEEAVAAAGEPVAEAKSEISQWGIATCTFDPADGLIPPVVLEVRPGVGAYETALEMASSGEEVEQLDGVGDRAFYGTLAGHNIVLVAGDRYANLIVRRAPDGDNKEAAINLARSVAERLR